MSGWASEPGNRAEATTRAVRGVRATVVAVLALTSAAALAACGPSLVAKPTSAPQTTTAASSAAVKSGSGSPTSASPATSSTAAAVPASATPTASTPSRTGTTTQQAVLSPGATGDKVRELQSRLTQLQWYSGTVTDSYGTLTTAAVRGFQDKRGLAATGTVDATTWARLVAMTRTPTHDEMYNVLTPGPALLAQGATGDKVKDLQARLKQIGWWSGNVTDTYGPATVAAVKGFQDKRGIPVTGAVDQRTTDRLTAMTHTPTSAELNNVAPAQPAVSSAALDPRCLTGRVICISKANRELVWVVDGKPQLSLDVRFGSENNPTREGDFTVYRKNREWTSTLYGSSMPFSMFFSGGEAVHYSSDFAARGYAGASHGCVNVRDYNGLASLFDQVVVGDKVVVS